MTHANWYPTTGILRKKSKIANFADFLELHLADTISRVMAQIESAILAITLALYRLSTVSPLSIESSIFAMLLIESSIFANSLDSILDFGDESSDGLFICQLYSLPDLLEETDCRVDFSDAPLDAFWRCS
jgi:hypothetical protein